MKNKLNLLIICGMLSILFSGFVWYPDHPEITKLEVVQTNGQTEVFLKMTKIVEPIVEIENENSAVRFDFPGILVTQKLLNKVLTDKYVSLGYLFNHPGSMKVACLRLFPNRAGLRTVKRWQQGIQIIIVENGENAYKRRFSSETLLNPEEEKFAPVNLNLINAPALPIMQELAQKADIDLRFTGDIPEKISINVDAANALEALKAIADEAKIKMEQREKIWWLCGTDS